MKFIKPKSQKMRSIIVIKKTRIQQTHCRSVPHQPLYGKKPSSFKQTLCQQLIRFSLISLLTPLGVLPAMAADMEAANNNTLINENVTGIPVIDLAPPDFAGIPDNSVAETLAQMPIEPANSNTLVSESANGVPIINIATPNTAGISHNRYQHFDVPAQGAVLNNSMFSTETTLAGEIAANPHLQGTAAELIINEVVSADPSLLQGLLEVAGQQADVIVANPYGITCDGCGFINTTDRMLTTGIPQFDSEGHLNGLDMTSPTRRDHRMINLLSDTSKMDKAKRKKNKEENEDQSEDVLKALKAEEHRAFNDSLVPTAMLTWIKNRANEKLDGKITIKHLDTQYDNYEFGYNAPRLSLIANTIGINNLHTQNDLILITGKDRYDIHNRHIMTRPHNNRSKFCFGRTYEIDNHGQVYYFPGERDIESDRSEPRPALAIDVSHLGGLSAGSISIVSNDKGAGVTLNNIETTNLRLTAQGNITSNNAHARESISIIGDEVQLTGIHIADGAHGHSLDVRANTLDNQGQISADHFDFIGKKFSNSGEIKIDGMFDVNGISSLTQSESGQIKGHHMRFNGSTQGYLNTKGVLMGHLLHVFGLSLVNQGEINVEDLIADKMQNDGKISIAGKTMAQGELRNEQLAL